MLYIYYHYSQLSDIGPQCEGNFLQNIDGHKKYEMFVCLPNYKLHTNFEYISISRCFSCTSIDVSQTGPIHKLKKIKRKKITVKNKLTLKSIPTVEIKLPHKKAPSLNRTRRHVLPTPESPTNITLKVGETKVTSMDRWMCTHAGSVMLSSYSKITCTEPNTIYIIHIDTKWKIQHTTQWLF